MLEEIHISSDKIHLKMLLLRHTCQRGDIIFPLEAPGKAECGILCCIPLYWELIIRQLSCNSRLLECFYLVLCPSV